MNAQEIIDTCDQFSEEELKIELYAAGLVNDVVKQQKIIDEKNRLLEGSQVLKPCRKCRDPTGNKSRECFKCLKQ